MAWDEKLKEKVIAMYKEGDPTPETSTEIIKDIAEELDQSPNGVRMVLIQAGVYVKKEPGSSSTKTAEKSSAPKRVSKEASIAELKALIQEKGGNVDEEILDKLTGKAAVYLTSVIKAL
jgi:transposase-like protein